MGSDSDLLLLEDGEVAPTRAGVRWRVLVVDDDADVHDVTRLVLTDFSFDGHRLELLHAQSAEAAFARLQQEANIAVILLDVVMETQDAGLRLVERVREELGNRRVRIILRTGQAGAAPELEVVRRYDINDYRGKAELTRINLFTSLTSALRSWVQLGALEDNSVVLQRERDADRAAKLDLQDRLNIRNQYLVTLSVIGQELTGAADLQPVFERLFQRLNGMLGVDGLAIAGPPDPAGRVEFVSRIAGGERQAAAPVLCQGADDALARCLSRGESVIEAADAPALATLRGLCTPAAEAVALLPLHIGERIIGALLLHSHRAAAFGDDEQEFLRILAGYLAIALDNHRATRELQQALQQVQSAQRQLVASERLAAAGQLTVGVAQGINDPTNIVYGAMQNLRVQLGRLHDFLFSAADSDADAALLAALERHFGALDGDVGNALEGCRRIRDIVSDLRAYAGLDESERKVTRIIDALRSSLTLLAAGQGPGLRLADDLGADPLLYCYPARLNQALVNLAKNACEAVARQGGGQVRLSSRVEHDRLQLRIEDDGPGIAEDLQARIFEPFFTTKPLGQGSGLGLSVAAAVVREHGGDIELRSAPGRGSCFCVSLPLAL